LSVGANVLSYRFFQSSSPLATSMPNRSSEIPATIRDLARASRRRHTLGNQRREEVVHLARLAIELDLPQQLHVLDVGQREDFLVFHPARTARVVAFGQVVGRR
jgi:hypothetical protein